MVRFSSDRLPRFVPLLALAVVFMATAFSDSAQHAAAAEPSNDEQYLLELVNRMRANPQTELGFLVNLNYDSPVTFGNLSSDNTDVRRAITSFQVDAGALASQWAALSPVPPVAWNSNLGDSAKTYSNVMIAEDGQGHNLDEYVDPDGTIRLTQRFIASGYSFDGGGVAGENIFAFTESLDHAHAAFAIDWGNGPTGIQNPAGHRDLIMDERMREIGIGIVPDTSSDTRVGPLVVTEHFAVANNKGPFLTGVAYTDNDGDAFYTPGEGLGEITIVATRVLSGTEFITTTWASGGYTLDLFPSDYEIVASGPGIGQISFGTVRVGQDNIKIDFVPSASPLAGDINMDRMVDRQDIALLATNFGRQDTLLWGDGDLNFDDAVNLLDLAILGANFGNSDAASPTAVPEPASAATAMLAILCLGIARRRSKKGVRNLFSLLSRNDYARCRRRDRNKPIASSPHTESSRVVGSGTASVW